MIYNSKLSLFEGEFFLLMSRRTNIESRSISTSCHFIHWLIWIELGADMKHDAERDREREIGRLCGGPKVTTL